VFRAIARAKPPKLFVFGDGPRSSADAELCARARAVTERIDWDCQAAYDFSDVNLGCRRRFASGVDWVFASVDEAILLEDDCLPDPSFFPFCEAMLERYRDDTTVMMVSGSNYLERWKHNGQSYHFSHFGSVWGWASWRRAWQLYDSAMAAWHDEAVKARVRDFLSDDEVFAYQARRFDLVSSDPAERHSWDVPWIFSRLAQEGLTVVPAVNMIANIGNVDGRGVDPQHPIARLRAYSLSFPIRFQDDVVVDRDYDRLHVRRMEAFEPPRNLWSRLRSASPRRLARAARRIVRRRENTRS
jgi:hypothetical protein